MLVDEEPLDADEAFRARLARRRVDLHDAEFLHAEPGQVEHGQETEFVVGRLEDRLTFVEHEFGDDVLREHELPGIAEHIQLATVRRCRNRNRRRDTAAFKRRIGDSREREEPVVAKGRAVTFENVITVVRIPPAFRVTEAGYDPPAIRNRRQVRQWPPDRGLQAFFRAARPVRRRTARAAAQPLLAELAVGAFRVGAFLCAYRRGGEQRCRKNDRTSEFTCRRKHSVRRCR